MKAVILAAGQGTRIRSLCGERPKCLIAAGNQTILDHQLDALSMAGVNEVAIVVGYEKDQIIDHVNARTLRSTQRLHLIENHRFATTNNISSLWLALDWLRGDSFVVLNADVIFDPTILCMAVRPHSPILMIVDPLWRDETMKVIIKGGRVIEMSKNISREDFSGTYIGITVFSEAVHDKFSRTMSKLISAGRLNEFFNIAVQELANDGIHVGLTNIDGRVWAEIDDPVDLTFAQTNVFPQLAMAVV